LYLTLSQLEEKVAELEAKSYGTSVENENLRGILKRLQEENVALKQSAFTFSMPLSGSGNTSTPAMPNQQTAKPPSPPHSEADEGLRSINDLPPAPQRTTSGLSDSPDSLASIGATSGSGSGDNGLPKLYDADAFNAFAMGITGFQGPATSDRQSSSNSSTSAFPRAQPNQSSSSSATGKTSDVDALFASFYPNGYDNVPSTAQTSNGNATVPYPNQQSSTSATYSFGVPKPQSPAAPTFAQGNVNGERAAFNPMAYRDPAGVPASAAAPAAAAQPAQDAWADLSDNSVNDFLASLTGANNETVDQAGPDDDFFNAQLQQILQQSGSGNSPSAAFVLPQNGPSFSPTNYLNMSPSPLNSISNSQSHGSRQTTSNSASPESTCPSSTSMGETYGGGVSTFGPPKAPSELVYIVDDEGKVIKPSELWMKMGLQHEVGCFLLRLDLR